MSKDSLSVIPFQQSVCLKMENCPSVFVINSSQAGATLHENKDITVFVNHRFPKFKSKEGEKPKQTEARKLKYDEDLVDREKSLANVVNEHIANVGGSKIKVLGEHLAHIR